MTARLRRLADSSRPGSPADRFRQRRFARFRQLVDGLPGQVRILDVGGTTPFWERVGYAGSERVEIVLLNLMAQESPYENMSSAVGDAADLSEYGDDAFDVVLSNSVIEHLPTPELQARMGSEVRRVGKRVYLQTPNRYFPLEPHFLFPFFGVLPMRMRAFLLRHMDLGCRQRQPDPDKALAEVRSVRLMTGAELHRLFPSATFENERMLLSPSPSSSSMAGTYRRSQPMIDLTGKSALVTGGSRGIGRAIALRLATQGADVAITYKGNATAAADTVAAVEALGRRALAVQGDASLPETAEAVVKTVLEAFGKIDILVNNAGVTRDDLIMRMSVEAWREVLETNLFGAFYMTKAVTRPMLKAKGGRIVNITSVSGQAGQMGQANYSSAKAGLIGLTKATARELASRTITCNAVAPGFVDTELTHDLPDALKEQLRAATPLGRFGETEEISAAVAFLASDEAAFITGQVLAVDGGLVMM